jgi:spermidine synthase
MNPTDSPAERLRAVGGSPPGTVAVGLRLAVGASLFLSGATALVFEVLWSRQFVTVFGNSSYAISIVLCAFMAGLGVGSWLGGRLADRIHDRLFLYAAMLAGIALCAVCMPLALDLLRTWTPRLALLSPRSLPRATVGRFVMSLGVLFVPCMLMGGALPVLIRFCTEAREAVGRRVGLLYGLNTLGAAAGCYAAGSWMLDSLGISLTNQLAVATNLALASAMLVLGLVVRRRTGPADVAVPPEADLEQRLIRAGVLRPARDSRKLLLAVAFLSGVAGLSCEVLWMRYLAFFSTIAYTFTTILTVYLIGIAAGSLVYRVLLARVKNQLALLAIVELLLGLAVPVSFAAGAALSSAPGVGRMDLEPVTAITVLVPTMLMGVAFPIICACYTRSVATTGRAVGVVYAVNTAGTIVGSLAPVFLLIPLVGVETSLLLVSLLFWAAGLGLLCAALRRRTTLRLIAVGAAVVLLGAGVLVAMPRNYCQRVFLSQRPELGRHSDILFWREGRTGTAIVVEDKVNGLPCIYINGTPEVPTTYDAMSCFKLLGALGPLLHPDPDDVLMICFGGGIAAGTATQFSDVRSLCVVDLESSVVEAARLLERENNGLLSDRKVEVVIDDGRNYILNSPRKWPVIVSDSTHPKSSDSWVLYTREFYEMVADHLTEDGVFVQWLPIHNLHVTEYKILARTFQSVFPHTSVWFSHGIEETGLSHGYTMLVATPTRLAIDVGLLERKLAAPAVAADLRGWGMDSVAGVLENFLCGEETLREFTGKAPVNTDDLPYTQYKTRYTKGQLCTMAALGSALESVWRYVRDPGETAESRRLKEELDRRAAARRLMFVGRWEEAFALLPEEPKARRYRENAGLAARYLLALAEFYAGDATALWRLARRAMDLPGDADSAVVLFERALTLDPQNARVHHDFAVCLARQGNSEEAIAHFEQALRLDPGFAAAQSSLKLLERNRDGRANAGPDQPSPETRLPPVP